MRRYLTRYIHHAHNITDLSCLKFTTYNQYESLILPLLKFLENNGVQFQYHTIVKNVEFNMQDGQKKAVQLICTVNNESENIKIGTNDLVFITLGSNTEQSGFGDQNHPA